MSKRVKVLLWVLGGLIVLAAIAFFVMFGPPNVSARLAMPSFCGSCHEMEPWLSGFRATAHKDLNSCNDCHLPHGSKVEYYTWEVLVGVRDLAKHTVGAIPDTIEARDRSRGWIQVNCRRCHDDEIEADHGGEEPYCWNCHEDSFHQVKQSSSRPKRREVRLYFAYGLAGPDSPSANALPSRAVRAASP